MRAAGGMAGPARPDSCHKNNNKQPGWSEV